MRRGLKLYRNSCITQHDPEPMAIITKQAIEIAEKDKRIVELEAENQYYATRSVPIGIPPIVCLCGSTRFMNAFFEAGWTFTLEGMIVLSVGVCKHAEDHGGEALGQDVADKLDELHLCKIDLLTKCLF